MGRKAFKNVAEPQERLDSYAADVHSVGCQPTEMALDSTAREDCHRRCDPPESVQSWPAEPAVNEPTEEQVRQRAYAICLARNGEPGDPVADWLLAEQELRARRSSQVT